jgi:uncharacterized DUF497 family protein
MRLAGDPEAASWLDGLAGRSEDFQWDDGNRLKSRKHQVEPEEVQELLRNPAYFAGRIIDPVHEEPRWLLLGQTLNGRRLALVFTRSVDQLRPISCRPMRRKERNLYEEAIGSGASKEDQD